MLNLFTLVLQITVILAVCRLVGTLFRRFHQPRVVGESAETGFRRGDTRPKSL